MTSKKQIRLKCPPRKMSDNKNAPIVYTIDDGSESGCECSAKELQRLTGMHHRTVASKLARGIAFDDPDLFTLLKGTNQHKRKKKKKQPQTTAVEKLRDKRERCPLRGSTGATVRFSRASFERACKRMRLGKMKTMWGNKTNSRLNCAKCDGDFIPEGIEIISEQEMAELEGKILKRWLADAALADCGIMDWRA